MTLLIFKNTEKKMTYKVTCKRGKNVTVADRVMVLKMVKRCMTELNKPKHEIGFLRQKSFWKPLEVRIKNKGTSCAMKDSWISIDLSRYHKGDKYFLEYAAYKSDPVIGERKEAATPESMLFGIVAHEVAHHVQFAYGPYTRMYKGNFRKPHGHCFQDIYRILRSTLVNPELDASADRRSLEEQSSVDSLYAIYLADRKVYMAKREAYKKGLNDSRLEEAHEIYDEVCTLHTVVIKSYEAYKVLAAA
jgi:hypothetical protein